MRIMFILNRIVAFLTVAAIAVAGVPLNVLVASGEELASWCCHQPASSDATEPSASCCVPAGGPSSSTDEQPSSEEQCPCSGSECCCLGKMLIGVVRVSEDRVPLRPFERCVLRDEHRLSRADRPDTPPPKLPVR
jgi:hypothetical protein